MLGPSAVVAGELAAGHLVRRFELSLPAGFAHYVVYPQRALAAALREGVSRLADGRGAKRIKYIFADRDDAHLALQLNFASVLLVGSHDYRK